MLPTDILVFTVKADKPVQKVKEHIINDGLIVNE